LTIYHHLLEGTLDTATGTITLDVLLNGAAVRVTRQMAKRNVITVQAEGTETLSTVEDVRTLIPTQQYRQGELSDLARGDAEKRLLALITGQAAQRLGEVETKLKKNAQGLSESLAKAVRLSAARQVRSHAETQIKLLRAQVDNLKKLLITTGQAPTPAVEGHDKYMRQQAALVSTRTSLEKGRSQIERILDDFIKEIGVVSDGQPLFGEIPELAGIFGSLTDSSDSNLSTMNSNKDQIKAWFDHQFNQLAKAEAEWVPKLQQHQTEYEEQKKTLAGKQSVIESIEQLSAQEREAAKQLETAINEEVELRDADTQLNTLKLERGTLAADLSVIVSEQLGRIESASSGLARGRLAVQPDINQLSEAVRKAFDLPQMRENRLESILSSVRDAEDKSAKWKEIQEEMLLLLKWKEGAPTEKGQAPSTPILQGALEDGFMEKLREHISTDRVSLILTAIVRPRADISHVRGGVPIEFRKASQGEQAASLLNILMNQSNGPLIIDQPEEDLDNKIINEIIRTISKAKDERQLILATHNANIVVNGDSENVIELVLGKQTSGGAIDEQRVRLAITDTMEGGKDAFELRRKKYNF
jgi:chromosome segregation protein